MNDAEKIVIDGAKRIEDTGSKVKFNKLDFSSIKTGLDDITKNINIRFGRYWQINLRKSD